MTPLNSTNYTKDELDSIINAFYDIADVITSNDFANETGVTDASAALGSVEVSTTNFIAAKALVYGSREVIASNIG